jgi:amidase
MAAKFSLLIVMIIPFVSAMTPLDWTSDMWKLSEIFSRRSARWQHIASEKREANLAKIPPEWILEPQILEDGRSRHCVAGDYIENLLDAKSQYVTDMDIPELVARMENGTLTAEEVVTAFCKRAAYAHQLVSLVSPLRVSILL